jgi:hypothetical protein
MMHPVYPEVLRALGWPAPGSTAELAAQRGMDVIRLHQKWRHR